MASPSVRFTSTLLTAEGKQATGIVIPPEAIEALGAGKRPAVRATLNGFEFRTTVGVMAGVAMLGVSAAIRTETGLVAGDTVDVELVADATPRAVVVPDDFAAALAAAPAAGSFFAGLSNSLQRYHIDNVNGAKTADTRLRRIERAVALFESGTPR